MTANMRTPIITLLCLTVISSVVAIDLPSPPEILEVECKKRSAILSWSPTGNAVVNEYKIQYTTNWFPNHWVDYVFAIPLKERHVALRLSPWANYTFRVVSINNAGASNHSGVSETCMTEEDVPHKNPEEVYGRGNGPKNLVISWKPMPPIEQNAPGFFYTVYWRLKDVPNSEWNLRHVLDWQQHRLVIENLPKLTPYRIKVEAHNSMGRANKLAEEVIGISDEDRPSEAPKRLQLMEIIDGKSAKLEWEGVPPLSINGHFKGYKVQVWTDSYDNRTEQIVSPNITKALIDIFTPGVVNNVQVLAFNGANDGPPSNRITQEMPFDIYPDRPGFIWSRVTDQKNIPVIRITYEPNMTNTNPGQKFYVQYRQKGIDSLDKWLETYHEVFEVNIQPNDLNFLEFDKYYEIRVVAESGKLKSFSNISTIDTHSHKWPKPTTTTTPSTPPPPPTLPPFIDFGDNDNINEPFNEKDINSIPDNRGLQPEVTPGSDTEGDSFSKTPWFIAVICVLVFICVFVGVFMYLKRRRSGGHEVNRNQTRVKSDKIRNTSMTANNTNHTTEPNERNSLVIDMSAARNGSVGHDEGDDYEDDRRHREVYNGTTETHH